MTELCRYPIINTGLKNDLIIEVFCVNLTYVREWRTHEEIKDRGYYIVFHGEMEILYWKNRIYVDTKNEQDEL